MPTQERKAMLGHKVRRLRRELGLTQAEMAERLEISTSYVNLIEHNQRPVTVGLLLKLGSAFDVDLQSFAEDEEAQLVSGLREVFGDPLFEGADVKTQDIKDTAAVSPTLASAVVTLYAAYREARDNLRLLGEQLSEGDQQRFLDGGATAVEEARDFFHQNANHFAELEAAAEALGKRRQLARDDQFHNLAAHLQDAHRIQVKVLPVEVMVGAIRRFDRHSRRLFISEALPPAGRVFHLACQIALMEHGELLDASLKGHPFSGAGGRSLARLGLANYFAGALMMPYDAFIDAAEECRYDIQVLEHRFGATFEQVCHRLTTLQRPGRKGIPFFMIRIDKAGNVSKRFSAGSFHFARFGGPCPRWNVHDAFRTPGIVQTQLVRMPDGAAYFSLACTVTKGGGSWHMPAQEFAIGLGCELAHARKLVYSDGIDLDNTDAATPIGVNCRLCERLECPQRAFPPLNHGLRVDESRRGLAPFTFAPHPDAAKRPGNA